MVKLLLEIQKKWDIGVIDLWNSPEMKNISENNLKIYMNDDIHPTRSGYRDLWLPVIREQLSKYLK